MLPDAVLRDHHSYPLRSISSESADDEGAVNSAATPTVGEVVDATPMSPVDAPFMSWPSTATVQSVGSSSDGSGYLSSSASLGGSTAVTWPEMSPHALGGAALFGRLGAAEATDGSAEKPSQHKAKLPVQDDRRSGAVACKRPAPRGAGFQGTSMWVDPSDAAGLALLMLDDRHGEGHGVCRPALPPSIWAEEIASFLRFGPPLPNMLYAFGGRSQRHGPMSVVEMFDTWHGKWTRCPPMPARRAGGAATVLPDGRMLVTGGYNERGIAEGLLSACDVYNPRERRWERPGSFPPLLRARWGHGCALLDGKVYVVGGCSLQFHAQPREANMETLGHCEVFDFESGRWSPCASLNIPRSGARLVPLKGDRYMVAIGGCDDVFGRAETQPTVELFDAETGLWSLLPRRLSHPRTTAGAVAIDDRDIYIIGGAPSLATMEVYHISSPRDAPEAGAAAAEPEAGGEGVEPPTGAAPVMPNMREGRMGCQAAVVNLPAPGTSFPLSSRPCIVVVGGERCDEVDGEFPRIKQFKSVPVFDVSTGLWRSDEMVPDMTVARTAVSLCVGLGHAVCSS